MQSHCAMLGIDTFTTAQCPGLASFPGLPRFRSLVCVQYNTRKRKSSSASVYYTERKPKNENGGGLGMRLIQDTVQW